MENSGNCAKQAKKARDSLDVSVGINPPLNVSIAIRLAMSVTSSPEIHHLPQYTHGFVAHRLRIALVNLPASLNVRLGNSVVNGVKLGYPPTLLANNPQNQLRL